MEDHANYTSYPKRFPIKHYKDLKDTFNSQDNQIRVRPHAIKVDKFKKRDSRNNGPPSIAEFRNPGPNFTSGGPASA